MQACRGGNGLAAVSRLENFMARFAQAPRQNLAADFVVLYQQNSSHRPRRRR